MQPTVTENCAVLFSNQNNHQQRKMYTIQGQLDFSKIATVFKFDIVGKRILVYFEHKH